MSTFLTILKFLPWALSAAGIVNGIFAKKRIDKKNTIIDDQEISIASLRDQIVNMVELQGDKNIVKSKNKKARKNIDVVSDDQLAIDYANELPNVPSRKRK